MARMHYKLYECGNMTRTRHVRFINIVTHPYNAMACSTLAGNY